MSDFPWSVPDFTDPGDAWADVRATFLGVSDADVETFMERLLTLCPPNTQETDDVPD